MDARTGKDYGLPPEYADWVEVEMAALKLGGSYFALHGYAVIDGSLNASTRHFFVPPKPKPTLPKAEIGGVIGFKTHDGKLARALRCHGRLWLLFMEGFGPIGYHDDTYLSGIVNADGFVTELEGL